MKLNAAIVEDNFYFQKQLAWVISEIGGIEIEYSTDSGEELIKVLNKIKPEIVFLDIKLTGISGIETAEVIRKQLPDTEIIFITSYKDYIKEAIDVYAADYITKPLNKERLIQTLNRIKRKLHAAEKILHLKMGKNFEIVREYDIFFIKSLRKKTEIYTASAEFVSDHSIKEMERMVDKNIFFRTGRSYLVNIQKIKSIKPCFRSSFEIIFKDSEFTAYLSKKNYNEFRTKIKTFYGDGDNK